ncbi:MAG TPA: HNH endonuclease [Gallicola sp.]|nr:HNH endonuclease [Gallicola sp.]
MSLRTQRKDTKLFFDSFKHIKNNLSNMIYYEIFTLKDCADLNEYLHLKSVNYKSKLPDMKKFGLVDYDKPSSNFYEFTEYGNQILNLLDGIGTSYKLYDKNERLNSISYQSVISKLNEENAIALQEILIKLIFSYYDSADSLRPYYLLVKNIAVNKGMRLTDEMLLNCLSQRKTDVLNAVAIKSGAFNSLDLDLKEEIIRPKSYILDVLSISGIIDDNRIIIISENEIEKINSSLVLQIQTDENEETAQTPSLGRPAEEQSKFRDKVLKAYDYKCAITGKCIMIKQSDDKFNYMLDAAHIIPFADGGSFSVNNGIALCREMHRLFDRHLIAFDYNENNQLEVVVTSSDLVIDDGTLAEINHKVIFMPDVQYVPSDEALLYRIDRLL